MATTSTVKRLSAVEKSPNWLEIPHELMANLLKRLGDVEILNNAVKVCTTWGRIGRDPAMWKVINMQKRVRARNANYDFHGLTKEAVRLSCGELIDISLDGFGNDNLLHNVVSRSSKLNSLCLTNCNNITGSGLNDALAVAKNMPELRQLQLYGNAMSEIGLKAILDGCPHLESLDIRTCYNVDINGNELKPSLERLKSFKGPKDSIKNCGFHPRIFENVDSDVPPRYLFNVYTGYEGYPSFIDYYSL